MEYTKVICQFELPTSDPVVLGNVIEGIKATKPLM